MRIYLRIRPFRLARRLTQTQLARRLHVSPATVCLWEKGQRPILDKYLYPLAIELDLLDHPMRDLFDVREQEPSG